MTRLSISLLLMLTAICAACSSEVSDFDFASYEADVLDWRAERLARLRGPSGYLNLAGLYWLENGHTSIGSAADNDIVFPANSAAKIGALTITEEGVHLEVAPDVEVTVDGESVSSIFLAEDTTGAPVTVNHRSLAWMIIKRDNRFALRLRDFEHPAIAAFPPIDYFAIDPAMRVKARFKKYPIAKVVNVETVIEGLGWHPESPGLVEFNIGDEEMQLEAYSSGEHFFFVFGDRSSGRETYPAGRFLYAEAVADGEFTWLDFNKAYNPPCAFNDFSTCPVASPQNRLSVLIAAGEKYDPAVHATPATTH